MNWYENAMNCQGLVVYFDLLRRAEAELTKVFFKLISNALKPGLQYEINELLSSNNTKPLPGGMSLSVNLKNQLTKKQEVI